MPPLKILFDAMTRHKDAATTLAIIGGFLLFFYTGEPFPKVNTSLTVESKHLKEICKSVIFVTLTISNVGKRPIRFSSVMGRLERIQPFASSDRTPLGNKFLWPLIGNPIRYTPVMDISPGESDQAEFEFIIDSDITTIKVWTELEKQEEHDSIWHASRIFNVPLPEANETKECKS